MNKNFVIRLCAIITKLFPSKREVPNTKSRALLATKRQGGCDENDVGAAGAQYRQKAHDKVADANDKVGGKLLGP